MTARPMSKVLAAATRIVERHDCVTADMRRQYPSMKLPAPADSVLVARALLSTSAAVRGMREALEKILTAQDVGDEVMVIETATKALAALSGIEGEDEQATRGEDAATAPTDRL